MLYNRDNIDYKSILNNMKAGIDADYNDKLKQDLARGALIGGLTTDTVNAGLSTYGNAYNIGRKIAEDNRNDRYDVLFDKTYNDIDWESLSDEDLKKQLALLKAQRGI